MSQTRVIVMERPHDYLYDKIYHLSSERDHARATFKANMTSERVQVVPNYPTMFSDMQQYPRSQIRLIQKDPVPKFINRHWSGFAQNSSISSLFGGNLQRSTNVADVGGRDRFRYFRRPIIPYATQLPPDVILATNQPQSMIAFGSDEVAAILTRTVATQTVFRDSEVQTDPYSPEYIVRPGEAPEVLTLATLSYGRGLPAGLHEVEMIERARHRREMEAQLPPINDFSQSEKRQKMMDAIEREEWAVREQQIEELQQLRLEVLVKLLRRREEAHQEMSNQKLDRLWNRKQNEKEHLFHTLRLKHVKALRQLVKKLKNVENKYVSRDVIQQYSDSSSEVWAPLTRIGQFIDRNSQTFLVNNRYLNTYSGLIELEESLPKNVLNSDASLPQRNQLTKAGFKKRKYRDEEKLSQLYQTIKEAKLEKFKENKPLRFLEKIEKPVPRPPTPTIVPPDEADEEVGRAVIMLQKFVRGRAIQAMMYEGKEKRKELIEELRSTHSLLSYEAEKDKQNKADVLNIQRQRIVLEHREQRVDEALSAIEGESIADMFDFLGKELVRLQEERRIHAFSMLAERERRLREAEESGLRQVEERRRREQDEIFKQMMKVHQTTVDIYLRDIIESNVDWTASNTSQIEIEEIAKKINREAYECEVTNTRLQQEEIVGDLIHNFLIPEVYKMDIRENIEKNQQKYLFAAHKEIVGSTNQSVGSQQPAVVDTEMSNTVLQDDADDDDEARIGDKSTNTEIIDKDVERSTDIKETTELVEEESLKTMENFDADTITYGGGEEQEGFDSTMKDVSDVEEENATKAEVKLDDEIIEKEEVSD